MIFIAPGDDEIVAKGADRFEVPQNGWKNISNLFNRRLADSRLPQLDCSSYDNFVLCAALPQTLSSRVALGQNIVQTPERVHFLNRKCSHCIMLSKELPRSRVVWLNRGEKAVPEFVRRVFSFEKDMTPDEFFAKVPFPHTLATAK